MQHGMCSRLPTKEHVIRDYAENLKKYIYIYKVHKISQSCYEMFFKDPFKRVDAHMPFQIRINLIP